MMNNVYPSCSVSSDGSDQVRPPVEVVADIRPLITVLPVTPGLECSAPYLFQ